MWGFRAGLSRGARAHGAAAERQDPPSSPDRADLQGGSGSPAEAEGSREPVEGPAQLARLSAPSVPRQWVLPPRESARTARLFGGSLDQTEVGAESDRAPPVNTGARARPEENAAPPRPRCATNVGLSRFMQIRVRCSGEIGPDDRLIYAFVRYLRTICIDLHNKSDLNSSSWKKYLYVITVQDSRYM